jgi:hypothetical protein
VFHDCVSIRKALKSVIQMHDGRVWSHHLGSPRYPYNAGSGGLVDGDGYPIPNLGWVVVVEIQRLKFREVTSRGQFDVLLEKTLRGIKGQRN